MTDKFLLGGREFRSRLLLGTANYPSPKTLLDALEASEAEILTVAIRRVNLEQKENTFLDFIDLDKYQLLPNTAGCYSAKEAVLTAELAREALGVNWIKVEVIADERTLLPEPVELLKASEELVKKGFVVLPYTNDDPILAKKLEDIGCAAVMPLAAPIGSGLGIRNPHNIQLIREAVKVPVIIDAGIGTASDAALAMELGADAVLINTAIAEAMNPVSMAKAMNLAIQAGRLAFTSGRIPKRFYAKPSTQTTGKITL